MVGIHTEDALREMLPQSSQSPGYPAFFLFRSHRIRSRPGGFSSDIQQVRPVPEHGFRLGQKSLFSADPGTGIEGIRGHVQNPHDPHFLIGQLPAVGQYRHQGPRFQKLPQIVHNGLDPEPVGHGAQLLHQVPVLPPVSQKDHIHPVQAAVDGALGVHTFPSQSQHFLFQDVGGGSADLEQFQGQHGSLGFHKLDAHGMDFDFFHFITDPFRRNGQIHVTPLFLL